MNFNQAKKAFETACDYGHPKRKVFSEEQIQVAQAIISQLEINYTMEVEDESTRY